MTRSQIDKLGKVLSEGEHDARVLEALNALYEQYQPTADKVSVIVQSVIGDGRFEDEPNFSRRPTKTLQSIVAKIKRERTRLSSMQDIIGCRIIVSNRAEQDDLAGRFWPSSRRLEILRALEVPPETAPSSAFPLGECSVFDLNESPRSGYRAIHVVTKHFGAPYEIQIRTALQNRWAQLSERLDDRFPGLKYGHGPPHLQKMLSALSARTNFIESDKAQVMELGPDWGNEMDPRFIARQEARVNEAIAELHAQYNVIEREVQRYQ